MESLQKRKEAEIVRAKGRRDIYYAVFGPYAIDLPSPYHLIPYGVLHKVVSREEEIFPLKKVWGYYMDESFYEDFQRDFMSREVASYFNFNRGQALFSTGQVSAGLKTIKLASEIGYDDDLIHNDIAIFFIDRGFLEEGRRELEKAVLYHEDLSTVYNNWGYYYHKRGEYGKAVESLQKAVALKPHDIGYLNNLGFALIKAGRKKEAAEVYERSLKIKPDQWDVIELMGRSGLQLSKSEEGGMPREQ